MGTIGSFIAFHRAKRTLRSVRDRAVAISANCGGAARPEYLGCIVIAHAAEHSRTLLDFVGYRGSGELRVTAVFSAFFQFVNALWQMELNTAYPDDTRKLQALHAYVDGWYQWFWRTSQKAVRGFDQIIENIWETDGSANRFVSEGFTRYIRQELVDSDLQDVRELCSLMYPDKKVEKDFLSAGNWLLGSCLLIMTQILPKPYGAGSAQTFLRVSMDVFAGLQAATTPSSLTKTFDFESCHVPELPVEWVQSPAEMGDGS